MNPDLNNETTRHLKQPESTDLPMRWPYSVPGVRSAHLGVLTAHFAETRGMRRQCVKTSTDGRGGHKALLFLDHAPKLLGRRHKRTVRTARWFETTLAMLVILVSHEALVNAVHASSAGDGYTAARAINETAAHKRKLSTPCFEVVMYDSFGDGWQGAQYIFRQTSTSEIVASGSLTEAAQATDEVCLDRGCYAFQVTGDDLYPSEVSWEFEGINGGSPFGPTFLSVAGDGQITEWDNVCPTPAPTISESPSVSPRPTPTPSLSLAPTTPLPTSSPIEAEVSTFIQLQAAISQAAAVGAKLIVALLADIMITETLTVDSHHVVLYSHEGTVLRAGGQRPLFRVEGGGRLSGINVTIRGGYSSTLGGAVINLFGAVDFTGCTLAGSSADNGGAVYTHQGTASLKDCTITGNSAEYGGAVYSSVGTTVEFKGCAVSGNSAGRHGGAVCIFQATADFKDCVQGL